MLYRIGLLYRPVSEEVTDMDTAATVSPFQGKKVDNCLLLVNQSGILHRGNSKINALVNEVHYIQLYRFKTMIRRSQVYSFDSTKHHHRSSLLPT